MRSRLYLTILLLAGVASVIWAGLRNHSNRQGVIDAEDRNALAAAQKFFPLGSSPADVKGRIPANVEWIAKSGSSGRLPEPSTDEILIFLHRRGSDVWYCRFNDLYLDLIFTAADAPVAGSSSALRPDARLSGVKLLHWAKDCL